MRSSPMPVSIDGAGSGFSVPSACRSNSMNTLFQISTKRSQLHAGAEAHRLGAGEVVAAEVVDLRAAAARAGLAHLPEVVRRAQLRQIRSAGTNSSQSRVRVVVARDAVFALEDRHEQLVGRKPPDAGQQLPGEPDRVVLEVVAEREVAEHLEERVVAGDGPTLSRSLCLPLTRMHFWRSSRGGTRVARGRGTGP